MEFHKVTKTKAATWCGMNGGYRVYHLDEKRVGRRVFVRWLDDADLTEITAMEGDGRSTHFKCGETVKEYGNFLVQPERLNLIIEDVVKKMWGEV